MTVGECKERVYMLLDEHSAGGEIEHDEDIELKMIRFMDAGQKALSSIKPIIREYRIRRQEGKTLYSMPEDFLKLRKVWRDGRSYAGYPWRGKKIYIPERERSEDITVEYAALPEKLEPETEDEYELEIDEDAAQALPYFICAQNLLPDIVTDWTPYWNIYQQMAAELKQAEPIGFRQGFWRG